MQSDIRASLQNRTEDSGESFFDELVSYQSREIVVTVNLVLIGETITIFGMAGNIINIIVFIKQGFSDTVNISLLALSVADMGSLITVQWFSVCVNPWFISSDLPFLPLEIQSLTAGFPHVYFARVTGFITAFISFERCLCVALPLKVKQMITKRLVVSYNIAIFLIMILTVFPVYYTSYYDWKFSSSTNKSKLGIFYTNNKNSVLEVSLLVTNLGVPFLSFFIIVISTAVTGITLKQKTTWRRSISVSRKTSAEEITTKERKVVVMITTVSIIFIISLVPLTMLLTARAIVPELNITGKYANMNWLVVSVGLLLEIINSSINIIVYYKMSTKYRATMREIFSFSKKISGKLS